MTALWFARMPRVLMFAVALCASPDMSMAGDWQYWTLGSKSYNITWTSDKTDNLSPWKKLDCTTYGPDYVLSGFTGYKEPWGNLDRFVARLDATCTRFDRTLSHTVTLMDSKHRDEAHLMSVLVRSNYICPQYYSYGPYSIYGVVNAVWIGTDPKKDYAQNFNFIVSCVKRDPDNGQLGWTQAGWETYLIDDIAYIHFGNPRRLECPWTEQAASAIAIRYDEKKGKIRQVTLTCRDLIYTAPTLPLQ